MALTIKQQKQLNSSSASISPCSKVKIPILLTDHCTFRLILVPRNNRYWQCWSKWEPGNFREKISTSFYTCFLGEPDILFCRRTWAKVFFTSVVTKTFFSHGSQPKVSLLAWGAFLPRTNKLGSSQFGICNLTFLTKTRENSTSSSRPSLKNACGWAPCKVPTCTHLLCSF